MALATIDNGSIAICSLCKVFSKNETTKHWSMSCIKISRKT